MNGEQSECTKKQTRGLSCYIFEFHQGQTPLILWNSGAPIQKVDDLMWYVVTTPAVQDSKLSSSKPSLFFSSYDSNYFIAFYALVPDVEARGFTRTVIVCVSSRNPIEMCFRKTGLVDKISNTLQTAVEFAMPPFRKQFAEYVGSLLSTMKTKPESCSLLTPIQNEILPLIASLSIEPDTEQPSREPETFNQINNNLRSIEKLFDFDGLVKGMENLLKDAIDTQKLSNVITLSKYNDKQSLMEFGSVSGNAFPIFAASLLQHKDEINSDRFTLLSLMKPKIFHHCLFTLMSGFTLIIESAAQIHATVLAKKFSLFVPFFSNSNIKIFDAEVKASECFSYSIVITPHVIRDAEEFLGILNTDSCYYEGPLCPYQSLIYSEFEIVCKKESSFLILAFNRLKEVGDRFMRALASLTKYTSPPPPSILSEILTKHEFNNVDIPLLQYWINSSIRKGEKRLIPLSSPFAIPEGIVAYYEDKSSSPRKHRQLRASI